MAIINGGDHPPIAVCTGFFWPGRRKERGSANWTKKWFFESREGDTIVLGASHLAH